MGPFFLPHTCPCASLACGSHRGREATAGDTLAVFHPILALEVKHEAWSV